MYLIEILKIKCFHFYVHINYLSLLLKECIVENVYISNTVLHSVNMSPWGWGGGSKTITLRIYHKVTFTLHWFSTHISETTQGNLSRLSRILQHGIHMIGLDRNGLLLCPRTWERLMRNGMSLFTRYWRRLSLFLNIFLFNIKHVKICRMTQGTNQNISIK